MVLLVVKALYKYRGPKYFFIITESQGHGDDGTSQTTSNYTNKKSSDHRPRTRQCMTVCNTPTHRRS